MANYQVDIVIIGGGLSGAALLHALMPTGLRVLMIDSQDLLQPQMNLSDARSLTLSIASQRILQGLNLWTDIAVKATTIQKIHVSEQNRFGTACLEAPDARPLGYVVPIQHLVHILYKNIARDHVLAPATVTAFDPEQRIVTIQKDNQEQTIQATLIVAADGSYSSMRKFCGLPVNIKEYDQQALVTHLDLARNHKNIAYERFTVSGPLALLPLEPKKMGLVWSLSPKQSIDLMALEEHAFLHQLMQVFGYRLGRIVGVGKRMTYPLRQMLMPQTIQGSVVFIGNAAHTLHPVAGQGFNLGLRDVAMLAQLIRQQDLNSPNLLTEYQQARAHDQSAIARFTDGLIALYGHNSFGVKTARQLGLLVLDNNRLLKGLIARYASGLAGVVPDLVCGISL